MCKGYAGGNTLTTGESGEAVLGNLPLGTCRVVETKAPDGFVLNEEAQVHNLAIADPEYSSNQAGGCCLIMSARK